MEKFIIMKTLRIFIILLIKQIVIVKLFYIYINIIKIKDYNPEKINKIILMNILDIKNL